MPEQLRVPTTRRVLAYAREALRDHIADLLDDPSDRLTAIERGRIEPSPREEMPSTAED